MRGYGLSALFEQTYRCYPASFIDKPHLEKGDKIIMPPSSLDRLASLHIEYPMLFQLYNPSENHRTHCGVLEFVAEEGMIYVPSWMMQNMNLQEGDIVKVKNVSLKKGTYVKLQPHTEDFLDISNPKAVLETSLRTYSCLTTGDSIMVTYNNKTYFINIVETKPEAAISIIETDCEVDFATPLDYKEPERAAPAPTKTVKESDQSSSTIEEPKFSPFSGVGSRLDGKPSKYSVAPITSAGNSQPAPTNTSFGTQSGTLPTTQRRASGKLVFGANTKAPSSSSKPSESPLKEDDSKEESSKFQPFSGKSYSLKP